MGAFYNSICLPGDEGVRAAETLARWLALRGYEALDEPPLFDLDGEEERCAFILSNGRWTVLVYSHYDEERRLLRELQTWARQLLYIWVQDSEVWGYDLLDTHGFIASFNSAPSYFQSFEDQAIGSEERPAAEVDDICRRLRLGAEQRALDRLHRRSARFEEEVCADFCRLLGVDAAMLTYDDLERGRIQGLDDWRCRRLFFRQRQRPIAGSVTLQQFSLDGTDSAKTWVGRQSPSSLMPDLHEEMEEVRRRTRRRWVVLRPIAWLARLWRRWQGAEPRLYSGGPAEPSTRPSGGTSSFADRRLANARHSCRIILPLGVIGEEVSGKPSAVFKFRVDDTVVTCTARRAYKLADILRRPSRSEICRDEHYEAVDLEARYTLYKLPPLYLAGLTEASFLGLHVVQAPQALYVFLFRSLSEPTPATELAIRSTIETFKLTA